MMDPKCVRDEEDGEKKVTVGRYELSSENALERALYKTRAYASWRPLDPGTSAGLTARYAALPSSDKAFMRAAFPDGLVPDGKNLAEGLARGEIEYVTTSGTTDEQVTNIWNQRWWDFSERSSWKLNTVLGRVCTGTHREAILASARNVGFLDDASDLPFESRRLLRFLFLNERSSALLWTDATISRIARELKQFEPEVLEANPSYLARFARDAERLGLEVAQPQAIVFTYENPSLMHLRQIMRIFSAPLVSSYGTTETGYAFLQCERGLYHLNMEACRADVAPLDGAHEDEGVLRLTPFGNEWVAMLRFDPGDVVRVERSGECACGRRSPVLVRSIEGRAKSLTWDVWDRPVTQGKLDRVLAVEQSLVAYQMIQEKPRRYRLLAVLEDEGARGAPDRLQDLLRNLYGAKALVTIKKVLEIEPEPSGKYLLAKPAEGFVKEAPWRQSR